MTIEPAFRHAPRPQLEGSVAAAVLRLGMALHEGYALALVLEGRAEVPPAAVLALVFRSGARWRLVNHEALRRRTSEGAERRRVTGRRRHVWASEEEVVWKPLVVVYLDPDVTEGEWAFVPEHDESQVASTHLQASNWSFHRDAAEGQERDPATGISATWVAMGVQFDVGSNAVKRRTAANGEVLPERRTAGVVRRTGARGSRRLERPCQRAIAQATNPVVAPDKRCRFAQVR
jgi:hypothetical protein